MFTASITTNLKLNLPLQAMWEVMANLTYDNEFDLSDTRFLNGVKLDPEIANIDSEIFDPEFDHYYCCIEAGENKTQAYFLSLQHEVEEMHDIPVYTCLGVIVETSVTMDEIASMLTAL